MYNLFLVSSKFFKIALILFVLLCKLGVVNWSAYRQEFRVSYLLTQCLLYSKIFKDCPHGYVENGRWGVLHGFYSFKEFEGYCSVDCFISDVGGFQNE